MVVVVGMGWWGLMVGVDMVVVVVVGSGDVTGLGLADGLLGTVDDEGH